MIATNKLKGLIAERGLSQRDVAEHLGMSPRTFYTKMKNGVFDSDEMSDMIRYLGIDNPTEIFFADVGTYHAPSRAEVTT